MNLCDDFSTDYRKRLVQVVKSGCTESRACRTTSAYGLGQVRGLATKASQPDDSVDESRESRQKEPATVDASTTSRRSPSPSRKVDQTDALAEGLCIVLPEGPEEHPDFRAVARFNAALRNASRALYNDARRRQLWQSYKNLDESTLSLLPAAAWDRLWLMQSSFRPTDTGRTHSLRSLLTDITTHGKSVSKRNLSHFRQVFTLEELFAERDARGEALSRWEELYKPRTRKGEPHAKSWLELGARLHALNGDLRRAHSLIAEIGHRFHSTDPRLALVLVLSFNSERTTAASQKAWNLFQNLRASSKMTFTLDDLEAVFDSFVDAKEMQCAMHLLNEILKSPAKLSSPPEQVMAERLDTLFSRCETQVEIDECGLLALSVLPQRMQNRVIFDRWLRASKRTADANGIAKIFEFMIAKKQKPTTYQLNQLLQVWLTSGNPTTTQLAEQTALQMIAQTTNAGEVNADKTARPLGKVPAAAAGTFIKLAHFYAANDEIENARTIVATLRRADLPVTDRVISGVLSVYLGLRDFPAAWDYYKYQLSASSQAIGFQTFVQLWAGVLLHLTEHYLSPPGERGPLGGYPSARTLFAEMMKHEDSILAGKEKVTSDSQRRLHNYIIRGFCLSRDSLGAVIALQTLSRVYKIQPNDHTIGIIKQHIAREAMQIERVDDTAKNRATYYSAADQALLATVTSMAAPTAKENVQTLLGPELYQSIAARHRNRLTPLLAKYMKLMVTRKFESEEKVKRKFRKARSQMDAWVPKQPEGKS